MPIAAPSFARAVFPPRVRLGGRRLEALSLGHCLLLEHAGSPFAPFGGAEREPNAGDVALAWFLLSRPYRAAADTVDRWPARWALWRFAALRAGQHEADAAALAGWIADQCALPEHVVNRPGEGRRGAPTVLIYAEKLLELGAAAWPGVLDVSVAAAGWLFLSSFESEGAVRLKEPGEIAAEAEAATPTNAVRLAAWAQHNLQRVREGRPYDPARDHRDTFDATPASAPPNLQPSTSNLEPA